MATRRISILAILLSVCLWLTPCGVPASSTADAVESILPQEKCSLTITYGCEDVTFADVSVQLYQVATVSADYQYTLTAAFADTGLMINGIRSTGEWNVIRSTLEACVFADDIAADFTAETNEAGQVCFDPLSAGLYLAMIPTVTQGNTTYVFDAALVSLPGLGADGLWQYEVAVTAKSAVLPPAEDDEEISLKVLKLWKGDDSRHRPDSVEVEIFRNGESYQTVLLSRATNWSYEWTAPADGATWTVMERNVPEGYVMTVEEKDASFVLTNTWESERPEDPGTPDTGDSASVLLYIVLMNVSGLLLVILGVVEKRKRV